MPEDLSQDNRARHVHEERCSTRALTLGVQAHTVLHIFSLRSRDDLLTSDDLVLVIYVSSR